MRMQAGGQVLNRVQNITLQARSEIYYPKAHMASVWVWRSWHWR